MNPLLGKGVLSEWEEFDQSPPRCTDQVQVRELPMHLNIFSWTLRLAASFTIFNLPENYIKFSKKTEVHARDSKHPTSGREIWTNEVSWLFLCKTMYVILNHGNVKQWSIVIYENVYFVGSQWNFGEEIMIIKKACKFEFQISPTAATVNTSNIPNNSQGQTIFSQFRTNRKYCWLWNQVGTMPIYNNLGRWFTSSSSNHL